MPTQGRERRFVHLAALVADSGGRIGLNIECQSLCERPHAALVQTVPTTAEKQSLGDRG
jgi:hypothetical protein